MDERAAVVTGHNIAIHPWMWSDDLFERYQTDYTTTVCITGAMRLTFATVPHGSVGPATKLRRTVMHWFGLVQDDHDHLETAEAGASDKLSGADCHMKLAQHILSGSTYNIFAVNPFTFPWITHLNGICTISDALVGAYIRTSILSFLS